MGSVIGRISGMNSREIGRMRARQSLMKIGNILSNVKMVVKMVVNMEEVKREKKKMMVLLLEMLLKRKKKKDAGITNEEEKKKDAGITNEEVKKKDNAAPSAGGLVMMATMQG